MFPQSHAQVWLMAALVFAIASLGTGRVDAQDYPSRPVRVVVPFSPGGAVDGPMRLIAQQLSKRLGQAVFVENKPGAGATIGSELVAKAPPDGYTLLLASQTNAISATLYPHLGFDPIDDFAPISLIGREPGVVVVNPCAAGADLAAVDRLRQGAARPDRLCVVRQRQRPALFAAMLCSMTGMKLNHIPYRGSGQATSDLIGGQVSLSIPGMAGMLGHIQAGKLRALAVTGGKRAPQLPDVPTVAEAGVPGYVAYVWLGLLAPKGTPANDRRQASAGHRAGTRRGGGQTLYGAGQHRAGRIDARRVRRVFPCREGPVGEDHPRDRSEN